MHPPLSPPSQQSPVGHAPQASDATVASAAQGVVVPSSAVQFSRWLSVGSLLGLIVLGLAWELVLSPLRPGGSWLALKVLPLCIPLAGLLKNRLYTYRWVSLVVWLYFIEGVVRGWSDPAPGNWLGMAEVALCLLLFVGCTMHVRLRLGPRRGRSSSSAEEPTP